MNIKFLRKKLNFHIFCLSYLKLRGILETQSMNLHSNIRPTVGNALWASWDCYASTNTEEQGCQLRRLTERIKQVTKNMCPDSILTYMRHSTNSTEALSWFSCFNKLENKWISQNLQCLLIKESFLLTSQSTDCYIYRHICYTVKFINFSTNIKNLYSKHLIKVWYFRRQFDSTYKNINVWLLKITNMYTKKNVIISILQTSPIH